MLGINFLWNRIDFLKEHKFLPILLIWLHLGVWEKVFPVQTPGFVGVKEKIFLIILFVYLPNCCQMGVTTVVVTGYCIFWFVNWNRTVTFMADLITKCGRCYCHLNCIFYWLLLLPMICGWCCCQNLMADVVAICGWCCLPLTDCCYVGWCYCQRLMFLPFIAFGNNISQHNNNQ